MCLCVCASVQSLSHVRLFATPWTAACQASLSIINSPSLLKLMCIESVMPSNHLILCLPFSSCPQSFLASGSFLSWLFTSGGHSIGVSASSSVLLVNIQDSFPLGWTAAQGTPLYVRDLGVRDLGLCRDPETQSLHMLRDDCVKTS